ncbi:MAG: ABC transporter permease, partial [Gemmatimonadaceae bacterium]
MSLWTDWSRRMSTLFHRGREERELGEEMSFHLDMLARRLEEQGQSPDEAHRRARVSFGGVMQAQENTREARGTMMLEDLMRDASYAARQLLAHPVFTLIVTITLALGIGATTAIFSTVDHVLLRPAPFDRPGELVVMWGTDRASGTTREPVSWPDITDFRTRSKTVGAVAGFVAIQVNLTAQGTEPTRATAIAATGNIFSVLGVRPLRGRVFSPEDDRPGGPAIAVVSEAAWRGRFNGDPAIIGTTILIDEVSTQIVGVLPAGADFGIDQMYAQAAYHPPYLVEGGVDIWVPVRATEQEFPRDTHPFVAIGRLASGASTITAQQELDVIAADVERNHRANTARGVHIESLDQVVFGESRPLLRILLAAVVLLLVVSAVNVANLLLARGTARVREVALRGALGASSSRLTRQFIAEGVVLVLLGTIAGVGLAFGALRVLRAYGPADVPRLLDTTLDGRALAVTLAVAAVVGLVFGLVPVITALREDTMAVLKGEAGTISMSRRGQRLRNGLVTAQIALCVALAVCASLVTRSFSAVLQVDPGFASAGVMKAQYQLPGSRYPRDFSKFPDFQEINEFTDRLLARIQEIPGIEAAGIAASHPLDVGFTNSWRVVGREEEEGRDWPEISVRIVSAGYFDAMGLAKRRGRLFEAGDNVHGPGVALINETAARRFFAEQDPIGQEISFWGRRRRIIGVVGDERIHGLTSAAPPATYVPLTQAPSNTGAVLVRSDRDAGQLAAEMRRDIGDLDQQLAV